MNIFRMWSDYLEMNYPFQEFTIGYKLVRINTLFTVSQDNESDFWSYEEEMAGITTHHILN